FANVELPRASRAKDDRVRRLWSKDDRLVTGIVKKRTETTIVLQSETGSIVVEKADVAEEKLSPVSTMPEGLLDALKPVEIADLVAYVQGDAQVARRATRENAK